MSLLPLLQSVGLAVFALLLVAAAWQDLRTMRIANALSIAIVGVWIIWAGAGWMQGRLDFAQIGMALGCAVVMFALGTLAFAAGAFGGGDVKLLAAASLFAGPAFLADMLLVTAMVGGALGLAIMAGLRVGPHIAEAPADAANDNRPGLKVGMPYGPAIAAGGLWIVAPLALG
ncbi:MAG: hypothetical protein FJX02_17170 [Alphaproteobacteria bacterium]|nr:hypothetical protein [Alphaproteobacteria bacterium]